MVLAAGSADATRRLAEVLARGGLAIVPCDTIYGLVGLEETEARIRAVKGRGEDKPFLRLVADASWVRRLTGRDAPAPLARHWPGPLTLVVGAAGGGTVALRVPASPWLRDLVGTLDRPLLSTSVNRAGRPALWRIGEIVAEFAGEVDLVLDGGDLPDALPSTVVDATARPFRVLRSGAFTVPPEDLA